eukprot:TRINITY_DN107390_c0_g1_i1.p1 TRINITY_DN107390_c0_g1~~TRINITY_DN107390_c0_g1_i1.p1  ORF type:complete len:155 (-),score=15.19 TRINITY_DN107390_c0_g1_i1:56-490(-)
MEFASEAAGVKDHALPKLKQWVHLSRDFSDWVLSSVNRLNADLAPFDFYEARLQFPLSGHSLLWASQAKISLADDEDNAGSSYGGESSLSSGEESQGQKHDAGELLATISFSDFWQVERKGKPNLGRGSRRKTTSVAAITGSQQ